MGRNEKKTNKQTKQIQNEKVNVNPRSLFSKFLVAEIFSFFCKHKRQLSIIGGGREGNDSGDRIQFSMNCNNKAKINGDGTSGIFGWGCAAESLHYT